MKISVLKVFHLFIYIQEKKNRGLKIRKKVQRIDIRAKKLKNNVDYMTLTKQKDNFMLLNITYTFPLTLLLSDICVFISLVSPFASEVTWW